jgi:GntR family transcriptional regulator, arabinose operon transcriptional repressor
MNGPLQRDSDIPLYLQVSDILAQRIVNGECSPGSSLPAEPELCAEFNVARGTIRQALSKLEAEGFIRREQGRGTFVTWGEEPARVPGFSGNQIGLIVPYVRDSFVSTILLGAERAATEHNLSITFKHVENNPNRQNEVLNTLVEQHLAGIVLYPVTSVRVDLVQRLLQSGYPLVLVDRYLRGIVCDYVMSDHFGGGLRATQHLLSMGHKRIGFVSWRDQSVSLEHRGAGYRQALVEAGLPYDPDLTCEVEGYPSVDLGALCDFLGHERRVTAIFCANDQIALAVYKAARQTGLRVPEDLALVGFDNLDFTQHLDVPLTTVEQPAFDLGRCAVEALIRRIQHQVTGPQQIILPTRLIIRRSCGAALNGIAETEASEG